MDVAFLSLSPFLLVEMEYHLGPENGSHMREKMAYQTEEVCRNTISLNWRPSNLREKAYISFIILCLGPPKLDSNLLTSL